MNFTDVTKAYRALIDDTENPDSLRMAVAAFLANRLIGAPVWILISGPPGCGKTEIMDGFSKSAYQYTVSTISSAGLLPAKEPNLGLLPAANGKVLLVRDMSTVTQMARDDRAKLFSSFREIYDGYLNRHQGFGNVLWKGKIGFIGATTPAIETAMEFNGLLGERFLYHRMQCKNKRNVLEKIANGSSGRIKAQEDFQVACAEFCADWISLNNVGSVDKKTRDIAIDCALAASTMRGIVERDRQAKEITGADESPEVPTRIFNTMMKTVQVASTFNDSTPQILQRILLRIMVDCCPSRKLRMLTIIVHTKPKNPKELIDKMQLTKSVVYRDLEDLRILGVLAPGSEGDKIKIALPIIEAGIQEVCR